MKTHQAHCEVRLKSADEETNRQDTQRLDTQATKKHEEKVLCTDSIKEKLTTQTKFGWAHEPA